MKRIFTMAIATVMAATMFAGEPVTPIADIADLRVNTEV